MLITDIDATIECPEGSMTGTAVYEIADGHEIAELVSFTIGGLSLTRYQMVEAMGETIIDYYESRISEDHAPDPMGEAADRDFDRHYDQWVAE